MANPVKRDLRIGNAAMMRTRKRMILFAAILAALLLYSGILVAIYQREGPYNVLLQPDVKEIQVELTGEKLQTSVGVRLHNKATRSISSEGNIFLSYHLEDAQKQILQFDNVRTEIGAVAPYGKLRADVKIDVPEKPGKYVLVLDLVEEGVTWFSERSNPCVRIALIVKNTTTNGYRKDNAMLHHAAV